MRRLLSVLKAAGARCRNTLHLHSFSPQSRFKRSGLWTGGSSVYEPAYTTGFEQLPEIAFAQDTATVQKLQESREPARVYRDDPSSWIYRIPGMTEQERVRLMALHSELLLPLPAKGKVLGFVSWVRSDRRSRKRQRIYGCCSRWRHKRGWHWKWLA